MPHAIQIRQTDGPEVLNWTPIEVGEPGSGQVRLRQAAGARNLGLHHRDQLTQFPKEFAMSKTAITSPELAPPVGPFSQAIEGGGFLYFSGQVAQDPATGKVVEGGIVAETERVFQVNDGFERPVCFRQLEPQVVLRFRQVWRGSA